MYIVYCIHYNTLHGICRSFKQYTTISTKRKIFYPKYEYGMLCSIYIIYYKDIIIYTYYTYSIK